MRKFYEKIWYKYKRDRDLDGGVFDLPSIDLMMGDYEFIECDKIKYNPVIKMIYRAGRNAYECEQCAKKRSILREKTIFFENIEQNLSKYGLLISDYEDIEFAEYKKVYHELKDFISCFLKLSCDAYSCFLTTAYALSENAYHNIKSSFIFIMNFEVREYFTQSKKAIFLDNMKMFKHQGKKCIVLNEDDDIFERIEKKSVKNIL